MLSIGVGSTNPTKCNAVEQAFTHFQLSCTVKGMDVSSGVSPQPLSDEETIAGALNRAKSVMEMGIFDYAIGLEGGVQETTYGMFLCNWGAVVNKAGEESIGGGVRILLPEQIAISIKEGYELGIIMDKWTGGTEISKKQGAIGVLTKGTISRTIMFRDVVTCAFSKFL
ncbi:inosine/xanthosine triphosphatase [Alkalihalobacillus sp. LMS39]|uniref:inosine/xanthosine triphosphatase n=1 Tax=Alkalihalobacillus sp. LMS39 TaxID=2924032 RepID=UPI001FB30C70|nr:inosine/xanthosine triphosphatase [Alkalihalobacillus sp. LMS39]UOE92015.1 inosine/xanthosine triphosphatase [Alkalihalobacillus sp. LMS39]